jgi:hypothetical protein
MGNLIFIPLLSVLIFGMMARYPHSTSNRDKVLIEKIDMKQSLKVAEIVIKENKWGRAIGYWAMRDQLIDSLDAVGINKNYLTYIDSISEHFDLWHYSWAISNYYRNGDSTVQNVLEPSYLKSIAVAKELNTKVALKHITGEKIYMGYFHAGGWKAGRNYIVAPGDKRFRQSVDEFLENR